MRISFAPTLRGKKCARPPDRKRQSFHSCAQNGCKAGRRPRLTGCSACNAAFLTRSRFGLPLRQTLPMLLQHMRRGFGREVRVVQLLLGLGDFAFDLLEFLGRRAVSAATSISPSSGRYRSPRSEWTVGVPFLRLVIGVNLQRLGVEQQLQDLGIVRRKPLGGFEDEFNLLAGRELPSRRRLRPWVTKSYLALTTSRQRRPAHSGRGSPGPAAWARGRT